MRLVGVGGLDGSDMVRMMTYVISVVESSGW